MLVLSRKETDKILFPSLGITVEVLRVQGNKTRLGIQAPEDVPILRHEVGQVKKVEFTPDKHLNDDRLRDLVFAIRKRLDSATEDLNQLHTSFDKESKESSQNRIEDLFKELRSLEREANQILDDSGVPTNQMHQALLVEDSAVERRLLEAYLELCGFDVTTASDGQDALDYLSMHSRPDVVLLDMMMPRIDGPSFIKKVRADPKLRSLPIFALTSMTRSEVEVPLGPEGVDKWYVKPVNPKALVHDVATYLTNKPVLTT